MKRLIAAIALVIILPLLTAAGCPKKTPKPNCSATPVRTVTVIAPAPECSLPPASPTPAWRTTVSDGIYTVGVDIPPGRWESVGYPMDDQRCVWWISPDPSAAPGADLPSYNDFRHGYHYKISFTLLTGQGLVSRNCGDWQLQDSR